MQRKETAIEVKVGALVLLSLAVLVAFVFVLGDCTVGKGYRIYVDFGNAAGLKPGAPVRVSGIPAGTVETVRYLAGEVDPEVNRPVYVRAQLFIQGDMRESVRGDAEFKVTTQGVLGEPYIEVTSLDRSLPAIEDGQKFLGIDAPRLDMMITAAYESLQGVRKLVNNMNEVLDPEKVHIDKFVNNIGSLAGSLDERVRENQEEIDGILKNVDGILEENRGSLKTTMTNVEGASAELNRLGGSLNRAVGDGNGIRRTIANVESISESARREVEPTLVSIRGASDSANRLLTNNEASINRTLGNIEGATGSAQVIATDIEEMVGRIKRGEGSLGRLLRDEEIFEDTREFVRELKRRPWRVIWKE